MKRPAAFLTVIVLILICICGCEKDAPSFASPDPVIVLPGGDPKDAVIPALIPTPFSLEDVPEFSAAPYVSLNGGRPYFTMNEIVATSYEYYSRLDKYDRCGVAVACIGRDIMPTETREYIGLIKPTGWRSDRYEFIENEYIYNRCHLIGFQLAGENANERNLITGTRYMNIDGMLPFENMIASYVKETGNHVMYRVTPVFSGEEALARGVLMEAISVEDGGDGICFCIFAYNAQPYITINYMTGENRVDENYVQPEGDYVLNIKTKKFHFPLCKYAVSISESNVEYFHGSKQYLLDRGFTACGVCRP